MQKRVKNRIRKYILKETYYEEAFQKNRPATCSRLYNTAAMQAQKSPQTWTALSMP